MSTNKAWRHLRTLHFYPEYIDLPGVCIHTVNVLRINIHTQVCNDSLNITIVMGSQICNVQGFRVNTSKTQ